MIPGDVFAEKEYYRTEPGNPLVVNGHRYCALVVPECDLLPQPIADGLTELVSKGLPVYFVNRAPDGIPERLKDVAVVSLDDLADTVAALNVSVPVISPSNDRIRILEIDGDSPVFFLVNESSDSYTGTVTFPVADACYLYDPWDNVC